jgi:transposase
MRKARDATRRARNHSGRNTTAVVARPARRPLPANLPREVRTYSPPESDCRDCGRPMKQLGEDVSEMLEYMPEHFKVIRHVRKKLVCIRCDRIVQAMAPSRPIERGIAGPGLSTNRA